MCTSIHFLATDPMNGGGDRPNGSCYPHFTGYHGQKSQRWGAGTPQLLSSAVSSVSEDGLYLYNPSTRSLENTVADSDGTAPVATGIPVMTFVS